MSRFVEKIITGVLRRDPLARTSIKAQQELVELFIQETNLLKVSSGGTGLFVTTST